MNQVFTSKVGVLRGLIVIALAGLGPATVWGRDHAKNSVEVVQNLSLDEAATTMALEEDGGKPYLQIHFAGGQEAWVSISQPEKPLTTSASKPAEKSKQALVMVHASANEETNQPASKEFSLWDISKPKSPRLVGTFSDVSRVIEDPRGYIYVLHRDGLAVIRSKVKNDNENGPDYSIFG